MASLSLYLIMTRGKKEKKKKKVLPGLLSSQYFNYWTSLVPKCKTFPTLDVVVVGNGTRDNTVLLTLRGCPPGQIDK